MPTPSGPSIFQPTCEAPSIVTTMLDAAPRFETWAPAVRTNTKLFSEPAVSVPTIPAAGETNPMSKTFPCAAPAVTHCGLFNPNAYPDAPVPQFSIRGAKTCDCDVPSTMTPRLQLRMERC